MTDLSQRLREPLVLIVLIIAVAGWLAFIALWINKSAKDDQHAQAVAALSAERDDLTGRLVEREASEGALADVKAGLATAQQDLAAVTASRDNITAELTKREEALAAAQAELETRRTEADAASELVNDARAEAQALSAQKQQLAEQIESANQQLQDVGSRLEQLRNQEAEATARSAQLIEESAAATSALADAQSQLQVAREQLAGVQTQAAEATRQSETVGADLQALQQQVADLTARRDQLAQEVEGYLSQRDELQPQVEELAAAVTLRGEELSALEARIGEASATADTQAWTGRFVVTEGETAPGLSMTLGDDDRFALASADGRTVEGSYRLTDTELVLSDAEGSIGNAQFPMTCPVTRSGTGLIIAQAEGCLLSGLQFSRAP